MLNFARILVHTLPLIALTAGSSAAATLDVGPGRTFALPSQAAAAAQDGDVVQIAAGLYPGDVCVWSANNLVIRGVGGFAHLDANGQSAQGKGIWVITGANTTVEWIEFSGCTVPAPDQNGAGIRQEGVGLTLRHCFLHDNQDGILVSPNPTSDILFEYCEFAHNGAGDGQSHNMYIGHIHGFTFRWSYSHDAVIGHELKSRAQVNHIEYNRISDEATGTASYSIQLPNGGESYLIGNVIEQGPNSPNLTIISYADEGGTNASQDLYVVGNTIVNDADHGTFFQIASGTAVADIVDNLIVGPGTVLVGPGTMANNVVTNTPGFVDRAGYDFHLVAGSPAIDAGVDPGRANGVPLMPMWEYVHPTSGVARAITGAMIDVGAYEYASGGTTAGGTTSGGTTSSGTTTGGSTTGGTTTGGTTTGGTTTGGTTTGGTTTGGSTTGSTTAGTTTGGTVTAGAGTGGRVGSSVGRHGCGRGAGLALASAIGAAFTLRGRRHDPRRSAV